MGTRIGKYANMLGVDTSSPISKALMATGDIAGNAALSWIATNEQPIKGT
jgi:hypothetical protein